MTTAAGPVPEITPVQLAAVLGTADEPALLDVREPDEFEAWALAGAHNVPLSRLATAMDEVERDRDVVVVCASGNRSSEAVRVLRSVGVPARSLAGGMLAWASVYDTATLDVGEARVVQVRRRGKGCLSYLVGAGGEAFVIDPSLDVERYLEVAEREGWRITRVFDTHLHADHLSGLRPLAEATGASVHLNPADGYRFPYEPLDDNQWFTLGGHEQFGVTIFATPGHTPGSTIYQVGSQALLTGDTLFVDGVGRPDLAGQAEAFARDLYRSLHTRVTTAPEDVTVLPAHYGDNVVVAPNAVVGATLGELRSSLPQLSWPEERFVEWAAGRTRPRPPHYRDIVAINVGARPAPTDASRQLELGPNRCSA